MSRIELIIEQTNFLLTKQLEALKVCQNMFNDVLNAVQEKMESSQDAEEVETLERIHNLISGQSQNVEAEVNEDLSFLNDQLKALKEINKLEDKEHADEMLNALIDEDEEIMSMEGFKEQVEQEAESSRLGLQAMIADIKQAVKEGSADEVEAYLESLAAEEDEESGDADEEDDMGCGDCSGCGPGGMCGSGGCGGGKPGEMDLFSMLSDQDDDEDSDSHDA